MPNWTENDLYIKCNTPERAREVKAAIQGEKRDFDFNRIIRMPESIANTESGSRNADDIAAYCKNAGIALAPRECGFLVDPREVDPSRGNPEVGKVLYENIQKYGFPTWYEWACRNWGTKWNAAESSLDCPCPCVVHVRFSTAWCAPLPVIEALSRMFPDAEITLDSRYEGSEAPTRDVYLNGEVVFRGEWGTEIVDENTGNKFESWDAVPHDYDGDLVERLVPEKTAWYGNPDFRYGYCE
jgi:hypothetical protein